jgi:hypothetical protein
MCCFAAMATFDPKHPYVLPTLEQCEIVGMEGLAAAYAPEPSQQGQN